jgi:DNA-binding NtrC family response regulator
MHIIKNPVQTDQTSSAPKTAGIIKALNILIIEDEAMIAMLLAEVFRGMGHDICSIVSTEEDAVAAALRHKPDLMIVDEWLRRGSGLSAVAEISRSVHIPHVFITGDPLIGRSLPPGVVVIQKPFAITGLMKAIQRALQLTESDSAPPQPTCELAQRSQLLIQDDSSNASEEGLTL